MTFYFLKKFFRNAFHIFYLLQYFKCSKVFVNSLQIIDLSVHTVSVCVINFSPSFVTFLHTFRRCSQSNLSQDIGSAGPHPFSLPGMKLEAVMEHLQRQQEAKAEVNLQERHPLQAQFLFAQQAAAARASASRLNSALLGGPDIQPFPGAHPGFIRHSSGLDLEEEDGEDSDKDGQEETVDDEERDEVEEDDDAEEDDGGSMADEQENDLDQAKRPRLQPPAGFPFLPYPAAEKQTEASLPPVSKQEQEEKEIESPQGLQAFTSPNGLADWSFEERYRQVSCPWIVEPSTSIFLPLTNPQDHCFSSQMHSGAASC